MGGGDLFQQAMEARCHKPDSSLIEPGTQDTYNAQAKGFNDCLRVYVEKENNKISQIRVQASNETRHIAETYNNQIRDIEHAINAAIAEVKIVNGETPPRDPPPPIGRPASFPAPECKRPDEALLKPLQGQSSPTIQSTDKFEQQRLGYESCVRTFIAQRKKEIGQIVINAQAAFHKVAEDANSRITQINTNVTEALNTARNAAGERDAAVYGFHSAWSASSHSIDGVPGLGRAELYPPKHRTGSVTVTEEDLSASGDMPPAQDNPRDHEQ